MDLNFVFAELNRSLLVFGDGQPGISQLPTKNTKSRTLKAQAAYEIEV